MVRCTSQDVSRFTSLAEPAMSYASLERVMGWAGGYRDKTSTRDRLIKLLFESKQPSYG
jgi:hypothetical protein